MQKTHPKYDLGVAIGLLVVWWAYGMMRYWNSWPIDLSALWMAGRLWDLGEIAHLYDAPTRIFSNDFTPTWTQVLSDLGHDDKVALPFVYPPFWAWMLSHLGQVDPYTFFNVGQGLLYASIAASVLLLWRLAAPSHLSATTFVVVTALIAEATLPYHFAGRLGQPQLFLTLLIILAFERYAAGAKNAAAVALGLAASIKITPVFLVLAFAAERDWSTSTKTIAVAACVAVMSFVIAGIDPHLAFIARVQEIDSLAVMIGLNINFEAMMHMQFIPEETRAHMPHIFVGDNVTWINILDKIGLIAALILAFRSGQGLDLRGRMVVRLTLVSLATLLFGPLSWAHYYMLPIMMLPLLPLYIGWPRALTVAIPVFILMILPVTFTHKGLIVLEGVYPMGYWLGFAWFFGILALGPGPVRVPNPAPMPAE